MGYFVHPTAVIEPTARLGSDVTIGPLCYVGPDVVLGQGCELQPHATVLGPTVLGSRNVVHAHAVIGGSPQDRTHAGEPTCLEVGDGNVFREHVTVHRGTVKGGGLTRLGSNGLYMVGAHVAHDCRIGDRVTLTNRVSLGGHVVVGDGVICAGHVAVAPFVRLGRLAFIAGGAMVERDVPPFVIAGGDRARVVAINRIGLRRAGVPDESIHALSVAVRTLFRSRRPMAEGARELRTSTTDDLVRELVESMGDPLGPREPKASR
jgi:UDP-N-acetylglucosamine acyltransferase